VVGLDLLVIYVIPEISSQGSIPATNVRGRALDSRLQSAGMTANHTVRSFFVYADMVPASFNLSNG
jgi:hypothetical protein